MLTGPEMERLNATKIWQRSALEKQWETKMERTRSSLRILIFCNHCKTMTSLKLLSLFLQQFAISILSTQLDTTGGHMTEFTIPLALAPHANVLRIISKGINSLAVFLTVFPFTLVLVSIRPRQCTATMECTIFVLSLIRTTSNIF